MDTPVDALTPATPLVLVESAVERTARILESRGVKNSLAVATMRAESATGRRLQVPPMDHSPDPRAEQFQQLILQTQAEDAAAEKESSSGSIQ